MGGWQLQARFNLGTGDFPLEGSGGFKSFKLKFQAPITATQGPGYKVRAAPAAVWPQLCSALLSDLCNKASCRHLHLCLLGCPSVPVCRTWVTVFTLRYLFGIASGLECSAALENQMGSFKLQIRAQGPPLQHSRLGAVSHGRTCR